MSLNRESISGPQSSAGILGITAGVNIGGQKFDPRAVVVFALLFIIVVKVASYLV